MSVSQNKSFGRNEQVAAIAGSLVGAVPGGVLIQAADGWGAMRYFAWLVDSDSMVAAWAVWFGLALTFGTVFGVWMARSINSFTNTIIMLSRQSEVLTKVLVPVLHRSALTVTSTGLSLVYGNIIAFGVFAYLFPLVLLLNGRPAPLYPLADFAAIGGILVYAALLGGTYGYLLEAMWFTPKDWLGDVGITPDGEPTGYIAMFGAAVLGAVVTAAVGGVWMFRGFAVVVGLSGVFTGMLVWFVAAVALGVAFAGVVSRVIDRVSVSLSDTPLSFARNTVAGAGLGGGFGLLLGVVLVAVTALSSFFPQVGLVGVSLTLVYGLAFGTHTGYVREAESPLVVLADRYLPGDVVDDESGTVSPLEQGGFAAWRARRPFSGSLLLVLAGLVIAAIPIRLQAFTATAGASKAALGIVFGAMIVACGVFALLRPSLSTLAGVTGIALSVLSLIGALGGLIIGMLVGIVGGNLCIAWQDPTVDEEAEESAETRFQWLGSDQQQW